MRINRDQLNALLALPDDKLWAEVVRLGGGYGFKLPTEPPPKDQMARLREAANADKIKMSDAIKLLNEYRSEGKK